MTPIAPFQLVTLKRVPLKLGAVSVESGIEVGHVDDRIALFVGGVELRTTIGEAVRLRSLLSEAIAEADEFRLADAACEFRLREAADRPPLVPVAEFKAVCHTLAQLENVIQQLREIGATALLNGAPALHLTMQSMAAPASTT